MLLLLLAHAASASLQHLPVVLHAVADSSNMAVAELLLGGTAAAAAAGRLQQQVQDSVQQLCAA